MRAMIGGGVAGVLIGLFSLEAYTFAEEMMGKGMAVIPDEGVVYAPFDGTVEALFPTGHAIGLKSEGGVQLLIHIGLDTVNLNGQHFTPAVKNGDSVKAGDVLIRFDLDAIRQAGYDVTTPVIVTNSNDYIDVIGKEGAHADAMQPLLYIM